MTLSRETHQELLRVMLTIRLFEERVESVYHEQEIKCPVHFCIGQEAVPAGVCLHLSTEDTIFSTHRSHGHCIAKGMGLKEMMAELYGRATGCARGKGGSMHLVAPEVGIPGTTAIVGGSVPLAVGAALSAQLRRTGQVSVAFFGDGAVEEGTFYEALNFAALKQLPVIFVCENNFYATHSPQRARQPAVTIAGRGEALGIPGTVADGNDLLAVVQLTGEAVARARGGAGPTLLEFQTYRWKGHVGPEDDIAAGCRPADEHRAWLARCPLRRYEAYLMEHGLLAAADIALIRQGVEQVVEEALEFGRTGPHPDATEVLENVW